MTILVLHQVVPPTFYNKIAPMVTSMMIRGGIRLQSSVRIYKFCTILFVTLLVCQKLCKQEQLPNQLVRKFFMCSGITVKNMNH